MSEPAAAPADPLPWQTLHTEQAFRNRWLTVAVDQVQLPTGQHYAYTRLEPAGLGVAVIGFNPAGEVLLEREYRHGVQEVIWQLPGGLLDHREDTYTGALRELREETGYTPLPAPGATTPAVRYLGVVWDNPALGTMSSHLYAAWNLQPTTQPRRDPAEFVTLHWVSLAWLQEAVRTGVIKDRVVVAAVAYLLLHQQI
ncbi:MAG: NUDIX hydrolase [Caldilineaceae bacterium]|nr:NUDIX hydrolase [Caldilineaceae bacterium]